MIKTCPFHAPKLRPELPPLPSRIARLPIDDRGYPVPYFVAYIDGKPDFRIADPKKLRRCLKDKRCWVCGEQLGAYKAFVIGPMCAINRTTADPPSHAECAVWSVKACPFLSRPKMVRRKDELTEECAAEVAGVMIDRNPAVSLIWITKGYKLFPDGKGRALIEIGEPEATTWWREGRQATRAEVLESIESGIPNLAAACDMEATPTRQAEAREELAARKEKIIRTLIPFE